MIDANDAINALSIYKAQEAGAFGDIKFSIFDAGVLGSTTTDVAKTTVRYMNGEINKEQAKSEFNRTICTTFRTFVGNAVSYGVDVLATVIAERVPVIAPIVMAVKEYVKKPVVEAAKIAGDWVYEKVKSVLNKVHQFIFG